MSTAVMTERITDASPHASACSALAALGWLTFLSPTLGPRLFFYTAAFGFLGAGALIFSFFRLGLYTSQQSAFAADQSQALASLTRQVGSASVNIGATFFSIGAILFFYLFFESGYIPRILSAFGVFASIVVTIICLGSLIFSRTCGDPPVRLGPDGHRRSCDRLLADVCDQYPVPW